MRKFSLLMMILLTAVLFQACNSNTNNNSKASEARDSTTKDTTGKMTITLESGDVEFTAEAASFGLTDIELGKIAEQKAVDKRIKNFGAMVVKDHSKADDKLTALAKTKNITLPTAPDAGDQKAIDSLLKKSGVFFDKAYVKEMVKEDEKDIKAFNYAVKNCSDPDIKAFAKKTLPVLRKHLDAISTINDIVK